MIALTEDLAKRWLRERGLPGAAPGHASVAGPVVVKALVPTGRRGKAGAILMAETEAERSAAAASLIGSTLNGHQVAAVYVEQKIAIHKELYLGFVLSSDQPEVLISTRGGVDIEEVMRDDPAALVRERIDPLTGLSVDDASRLWQRAGLTGPALAAVAAVTARAYTAFCQADALLLEINPLALDAEGGVCLVGAMLGVDECALFRHPLWRDGAGALPDNPRERAVTVADRDLPGGACQYVELAGDIGLLVGGGGAGLYQHDLMLECGGAPANHCVTPPTSADTGKLKAVLGAIFDNPRTRGLLVGFNFAQMARADIRVRALVEVLEEKRIDTTHLPIVIRLFGAGEEEARAMIGQRPNVHYLSRGATLKDAVQLIVRLTAQARAGHAGAGA